EPDASRQDDRKIGADRVKAAMREVDDAPEREDQRQAKRDQQVICADQEPVENLFEYENELHAATPGRGTSAVDQLISAVPAQAGQMLQSRWSCLPRRRQGPGVARRIDCVVIRRDFLTRSCSCRLSAGR